MQFTYSAIVGQVAFFVHFEALLPSRKYRYNEQKLPFRVSELYKNTKEYSYDKWTKNFFRFLLFTYWGALVCLIFAVHYYGQTVTAQGKSLSLW